MASVYDPGWLPVGGTLKNISNIIDIAKKSGIPILTGPSSANYEYSGGNVAGKLRVTSTKRYGSSNFHDFWMAVDFAGANNDAGRDLMDELATFFYNKSGWLLELIHKGDTRGWYVKRGDIVNAAYYGSVTVNDHTDHVHVAMSPRAAIELRASLYVTYYTVVSGDNLTKIANKYNTTVNQLVTWNKLADPNKIYVGQKLRVS